MHGTKLINRIVSAIVHVLGDVNRIGRRNWYERNYFTLYAIHIALRQCSDKNDYLFWTNKFAEIAAQIPCKTGDIEAHLSLKNLRLGSLRQHGVLVRPDGLPVYWLKESVQEELSRIRRIAKLADENIDEPYRTITGSGVFGSTIDYILASSLSSNKDNHKKSLAILRGAKEIDKISFSSYEWIQIDLEMEASIYIENNKYDDAGEALMHHIYYQELQGYKNKKRENERNKLYCKLYDARAQKDSGVGAKKYKEMADTYRSRVCSENGE